MRLEYKYLVSTDLLQSLRSDLMPFCEEDRFTGTGEIKEYTVRSIYFDTLNLDYYFDKIEGHPYRKKVRVRGYNDLQPKSDIFLEIKRKFQNYISKNRAVVRYCKLEELLRTGDVSRFVLPGHGQTMLLEEAKRFFFHVKSRFLQPVVLVVYDREAFFCKFKKGLRITFDKNIRTLSSPVLGDLFQEDHLRLIKPKHFVLEIKFSKGFPKWLQEMIQRYGLKQVPFSKYNMCIDNLRVCQPKARSVISRRLPAFQNY
ncbi:MAG: VTC domain-containing protein [bacterium]